jgi:hypothetical protein
VETVVARADLFIVIATLPVFSAFLATTQQLIGGPMLAPAVILLLLSDTISFYVQRSVMLSPGSTADDVKALEQKKGTIAMAMTFAAVVFAVLYVTEGEDVAIVKYIHMDVVIPPFGILMLLCDSMARKTLTRVVSTDLVLEALYAQKVEKENLSQMAQDDYAEKVHSLKDTFDKVAPGPGGLCASAKVADGDL